MIIGNLGGIIKLPDGDVVYRPTIVFEYCRDATHSDQELTSRIEVEYNGETKQATLATPLPRPCTCAWVALHVDEAWQPQQTVQPLSAQLDPVPGIFNYHIDGYQGYECFQRYEDEWYQLVGQVQAQLLPLRHTRRGVKLGPALLPRQVRFLGMPLLPGVYAFHDHAFYDIEPLVVLENVEPVEAVVRLGTAVVTVLAYPPLLVDLSDPEKYANPALAVSFVSTTPQPFLSAISFHGQVLG